jgi:hypothetical protein
VEEEDIFETRENTTASPLSSIALGHGKTPEGLPGGKREMLFHFFR